MPSFEYEDGNRDDDAGSKFLVYTNLICFKNRRGGMMLFPRLYRKVVRYAPEGLAPLYPGGERAWRPWLYHRTTTGWDGHGSQNELSWRYAFTEIEKAIAGEKHEGLYAMGEAEDKAEEILMENLSPFQQYDWKKLGNFRVRGGLTGKLYAVREGNGFALIDPVTCAEQTSYCLHPEYWMPNADIALAHKLHLENPETELDALENGKSSKEYKIPEATSKDWLAFEMERDMAVI